MRTLKKLPNEVLRLPCSPIDKFDKTLQTLYLDMLGIMHKEKGVGIAAPQVGVSKQFCIVMSTPMCNPQIIKASEDTEDASEGCLSIPGEQFTVSRSTSITIEYLTLAGKVETVELQDYMARIALHEIDHLAGRLIIDIGK